MIETALLEKTEKIIICPFGENGMLTKNILNNSYGILETAIVDNRLCKYNDKILSIEDLSVIDDTSCAILLNTSTLNINCELEAKLKNICKNAKIINVMEPHWDENAYNENYYYELKKKLKTRRVEGCDLVRCGRRGDGGYILVDDFLQVEKAYSFGIADEISWETDVAARDIDIHMYDPTIKMPPHYNSRFFFHKIGVSGEDSKCGEYLKLDTLLIQNGDMENKNLILKMDVEGAEWEAIQNTDERVLDNFLQMSFEFHDLLCGENTREKSILQVLEKLNYTHQAVWVHANNNGKVADLKDGVLPDLLEVTFVNRRRYKFIDQSVQYPIYLDSPNLEYKKEIILGEW